jgi:hypothetical protein
VTAKEILHCTHCNLAACWDNGTSPRIEQVVDFANPTFSHHSAPLDILFTYRRFFPATRQIQALASAIDLLPVSPISHIATLS